MHIQFINRLKNPHVISYTLTDLDIRNIKTTQNASGFKRRMEYSETKTRPYSGFITLSYLTCLNSNILIFDTSRKTHSNFGEEQWNISSAQWHQYYLKISSGLYTIHSSSTIHTCLNLQLDKQRWRTQNLLNIWVYVFLIGYVITMMHNISMCYLMTNFRRT